MDNFTNISESQNGGSTTVSISDAEWYVCRYRTLTQDILKLETLEDPNLTIFLPVAKKFAPDEKQNCRNSRPVLPGFIFVKGSLANIKECWQLCRYHIMHTKTDAPRPITISDAEMKPFIRIASMLANAPDLIYSEEFDQSERNIVEFTEEGETKFAFIETRQGVKGGTLIVPVQQDKIAQAIYSKKVLDDFKLPPRALCYKISSDGIRFYIRHIAHGNTYDHDYINTANKRASTALQKYERGESIDPKTAAQLQECLLRYRNAITDKIKFQSKIVLLLYKCSAILQLHDECQVFKKRIDEEIVPRYAEYVESVRKDKRPATQKNFDKFIKTYEHTRAIEEASC